MHPKCTLDKEKLTLCKLLETGKTAYSVCGASGFWGIGMGTLVGEGGKKKIGHLIFFLPFFNCFNLSSDYIFVVIEASAIGNSLMVLFLVRNVA